jgi:hypothetical protein
VGKAGAGTVTGSTYSISGGGADIYGTADGFRYTYQTLSGDGQIIAKVSSLTAANAWAKVGVMIRNDNSAGAKQVSMLVSPNGQAEFERRFSANTGTLATDVVVASPAYVKLVRAGNTFTGYISTDGSKWTMVGSTTVVMNATVEIGLAVTSHDPTLLETATFDNVAVTT